MGLGRATRRRTFNSGRSNTRLETHSTLPLLEFTYTISALFLPHPSLPYPLLHFFVSFTLFSCFLTHQRSFFPTRPLSSSGLSKALIAQPTLPLSLSTFCLRLLPVHIRATSARPPSFNSLLF